MFYDSRPTSVPRDCEKGRGREESMSWLASAVSPSPQAEARVKVVTSHWRLGGSFACSLAIISACLRRLRLAAGNDG